MVAGTRTTIALVGRRPALGLDEWYTPYGLGPRLPPTRYDRPFYLAPCVWLLGHLCHARDALRATFISSCALIDDNMQI
jgi:hypothetical protein